MKLNKQMQYALLLTLYLSRSGRTPIHSAAEGLDLSEDFLQNVAAKLRRAGVITSVRGPGGGFEIKGDPTIQDIFDAIQPLSLISKKDLKGFSLQRMENRTLTQFVVSLTQAWAPLLRRRVRNVALEVAATDVAKFNRGSPSSQVN